MNEPTINVTDKDVLAILGAKEVELQMLRQALSLAQKKLEELEAKIAEMAK